MGTLTKYLEKSHDLNANNRISTGQAFDLPNMDYWSVSNWNIESFANYPTINFSGFGCSNIAIFLITKY